MSQVIDDYSYAWEDVDFVCPMSQSFDVGTSESQPQYIVQEEDLKRLSVRDIDAYIDVVREGSRKLSNE
jgi:hypothetical protein